MRTFGWTRTLLNKWEVGVHKTFSLRDSHPTNKDNRPSNVPDWSGQTMKMERMKKTV
ncbi:MAG: hypothetical protein ACLS6Y_03250 [Streptococcus salivarius]